VRFEIREVAYIHVCHCRQCRKQTGASYAVFAQATPEDFTYVAGRRLIERFESSPGNARGFCSVCGSSVPVVVEGRAGVVVPAGTLEGDPGVRPVFHMMWGSRAPWIEHGDELPHFEAFPPGAEEAHLSTAPRDGESS